MKNTVLFYKDEKSVKFWKTLPAEMSHKLLVACLEYNYVEGGGDLPEVLNDDPVAQALFLQLKEKIDYNEAKWAKDGRRKTSAENGRKHKKHEVVDEETGEMIEEHQEENKVPETNQETLKTIPYKDLPDNIRKMWNERRLSLGSVFSKTSRLSKESKKEKWESICSEYGVEPNRTNLKSLQVLYKEYERSKDYADAQFAYQAASMDLDYNN